MPEPIAKSPEALQHLVQLGNKAAAAKDWANAERYLRQCLESVPGHAEVLHNLGFVLYQAGRRQDAEQVLVQATQIGAVPMTFVLLGEIYESGGRDGEAFHCYKSILKTQPDHFIAHMKLGALRERLGDQPGARENFRHATELNPADIHAGLKYASAVQGSDPSAALAVMERLLTAVGDDLAARTAVLMKLLVDKESYERSRQGLMPWHVTHMGEQFFHHAAPYLRDLETALRKRLAINAGDADAQVILGLARFCLGDRSEAEHFCKMGAKPGQIFDAMRFDPAFYDELRRFSTEDLQAGLPPLVALNEPVPDSAGVLYLSCNYGYFTAFGMPMLCSLQERSPATPVHLHIMDPSEADADAVLAFCRTAGLARFAVSIERPGLAQAPLMQARCYYHAVRFIRFYQHLRAYGSPLWLMDVDAVVHRPLDELFSMLTRKDAATRVRPGRIEPWNQFNACVVGGAPTPESLEYFRIIAAYISYFHTRNQLRWGIDQLAMYGVYADQQDRDQAPNLAFLGEREIDYKYRDDGFIWCNSGAGKFRHLARVANPGAAPAFAQEENKFVGVFEKYWRDAQRIAVSSKVTS